MCRRGAVLIADHLEHSLLLYEAPPASLPGERGRRGQIWERRQAEESRLLGVEAPRNLPEDGLAKVGEGTRTS